MLLVQGRKCFIATLTAAQQGRVEHTQGTKAHLSPLAQQRCHISGDAGHVASLALEFGKFLVEG